MTPFAFIILSLACYRLTVLFVHDTGPFDVFKRARARLKMLGCVRCASVWIGAILATIYYFTVRQDAPIVAACVALALSSVAIILDRCFRDV